MHTGNPEKVLLQPRLFLILKEGYTFQSFKKDCLSGLTVSIIALPLSLALAIASGLSPEKGLTTAIIAGFLISFFSGSRVQIGGPTGAFVVIVHGVLQQHGIEGLILSTFMAGLILMIAGFFHAGSVIKYISQSVITGFTTGIALVILFTQMADIFGFSILSIPSDVLGKISFLFSHLHSINYNSLILVITLTIGIFILNRYSPRIPGYLLIIILGTIANSYFGLGFENIGDRFGSLHYSIPTPEIPHISLRLITQLLPSAFIIAFLAGVESLLSAVVADSMSGDQHHSNTELFAQGIANIGSAIFGGLPATGAIARTATNIKTGATSPISGLIHAVSILILSYLFSPYIELIPFYTLAAVLIVVAWNMSELHFFFKLASSSLETCFILLTTFLLTVFSDLTVGISVGVILSSLLFMRNMSESLEVQESDISLTDYNLEDLKKDIHIISFEGPLFFGSSPRLITAFKKQAIEYKVLIINLQHVPFIEATASLKLKTFIDSLSKRTTIILCTPKEKVRKSLKRFGVKVHIEPKNITNTLEDAIKRAEQIVTT